MTLQEFFQRLRNLRFVFIGKPVLEGLKNLADQQQRPKEAVAADLLSMAVYQQHSVEFQMACWRALTPREQDVTALCCLGYKNAEIAERLGISVTTVSTHVRHISGKFGLHGKAELRQFFGGLDFSVWEEPEA